MPHKTWILVANGSEAKLYANEGPNTGLSVVKEFDHPASRAKNADLVTDRAGRMQSSGNGRGSRQPHMTPKEHETEVFALELARELVRGRSTNQCNRVILVAPPTMMGLINGSLDHSTANLVSERLEKDYTKSPTRQVAERLSSCIFL